MQENKPSFKKSIITQCNTNQYFTTMQSNMYMFYSDRPARCFYEYFFIWMSVFEIKMHEYIDMEASGCNIQKQQHCYQKVQQLHCK